MFMDKFASLRLMAKALKLNVVFFHVYGLSPRRLQAFYDCPMRTRDDIQIVKETKCSLQKTFSSNFIMKSSM